MTLEELSKYKFEYDKVGVSVSPAYDEWCETHCPKCDEEGCMCWSNGLIIENRGINDTRKD